MRDGERKKKSRLKKYNIYKHKIMIKYYIEIFVAFFKYRITKIYLRDLRSNLENYG